MARRLLIEGAKLKEVALEFAIHISRAGNIRSQALRQLRFLLYKQGNVGALDKFLKG